MKREKARLRKERQREKLRNSAGAGDSNARKKIDATKKYDKKYSAQYRLKRKQSKATRIEDQKANIKIVKRKKSKGKRAKKRERASRVKL